MITTNCINSGTSTITHDDFEEISLEENSKNISFKEELVDALDIVPLSGSQRKLMKEKDFFLLKGANKVDEYLKKNHDYFRLYKILAVGFTVGAVAGIVVGGAVGGAAGGLIGGLPGFGVGIVVGGATGLFVGGAGVGVLVKFATKIHVKKSEEYKLYYTQESKRVINEYKEFLKNHSDDFKEFMCPLSKDLIENPVKYPKHEAVYESAYIKRWLNRKPNGDNSPNREGHMDPNKLRYDFTYFPRLIKKLNKYATELFERNIAIVIDQALKEFTESRKVAIRELMYNVLDLKEDGFITKKQQDAAMKILRNEQSFTKDLLKLFKKKQKE
ncbi:MAG: hypothetical protein AMS24_03585 [Chlamydiae bacterium SM23_39]|nr:MAG: hypothetical protein AMS24_03585 [Chlamydiae bacterium SM23_39]